MSLALGSPRSLFIGTEPQPPHVHIREVKDRIELRQRHALHGEAHLVRVGVRVRVSVGIGVRARVRARARASLGSGLGKG